MLAGLEKSFFLHIVTSFPEKLYLGFLKSSQRICLKLFRGKNFNFLVGNEDMHVKNFSLLTKDGVTALSPVYDLVNSTIVMVKTKEEIALPLRGKKSNVVLADFDYFAKDRLGLSDEEVHGILQKLRDSLPVFSRKSPEATIWMSLFVKQLRWPSEVF